MHYICLGVSSLHIVIDPVEQGREELSELASAEDVNPEQDQGKPGASNHILWALFIFYLTLWFLIVH
jgi:amino acid permease